MSVTDTRIKFINEVKRYPFLYDHNHEFYSHREKIESTWKTIADMFGEKTTGECKRKWRLIRCSYIRSLKGKSKTTPRQYYMASHLRFLDPFLKIRSHDDNDSEEDESMDPIGEDRVEVTMGNVKIEDEGLDTEDYDEGMYNAEICNNVDVYNNAIENSSHSIKVEGERKRFGEDNIAYPMKRIRGEVENAKDNLSPNELYLLSLSPYLEGMTERQKLAFQKGVVELIETIKYGSML